MSVITTILSTDALEPTSRNNINTNFANLNADKQEKPGGAVTNNIVLFGASNVLVDSGKAAPAGAVVGTTDTQALSNKDLSAGTNTFPTSLVTLTGAQALTNKDLSSGTNTFPTTLVTLTGSQTLTNKTLTTPIIGDFTNAGHNHQNAAGGGTLAEAALVLSDITTNNVSITKHGFAPKLPNDATKFLDGTGVFSTPSSGGSYKTGTTTRAGNASAGSQTIAHGLGVAPKYVRITAYKRVGTTGQDNIAFSEGSYNGSVTSCLYTFSGGSAGTSFVNLSTTKVVVILDTNSDVGSGNATQSATISVDATNITLTWAVEVTSSANNINIMWEAFA
jgi:hypothetical protein